MDETGGVKQTIMETSLVLFSEKGYEGVSVNELTETAGITKPTLYYYFGSKEGLFDAVCQSQYQRLNAVVAANAVYDPNPQSYHEDIFRTLTNVTAGYFSFAAENEAFYRLAMANLSMPRSASVFEVVKKYHFEQYEIIANMFRIMAKSHGNLRGKDKQLSWSLIGAINAWISLVFSGVYKEEFSDAAVKEFVRQFMHGIYA